MDSIISMQAEFEPKAESTPEARATALPIDARFLWSHPLHTLALGFGGGLAPTLPGATGTLLGWASFLVLDRWLSPLGWAWVLGIGFLTGLAATGYTARRVEHRAAYGTAARVIVWDHIVAFWLVLLMVTPASFGAQLVAFLLFRFFDSVTVPPVRYVQRRLSGGMRIMVDDVVAAFLTLLVIAAWRAL
jgi:phosphatidylglycerophosphatase A